jgi:hypothetical protein
MIKNNIICLSKAFLRKKLNLSKKIPAFKKFLSQKIFQLNLTVTSTQKARHNTLDETVLEQ